MTWSQLDVSKPHLVYIILGGFTSLFMLCSSVIKERFYIGEATVATLCGICFGPHAANLIDPGTWGDTDQITLEFARIVLVVQCFAVGVELPRNYMERHWRSVVLLLIPVMTFGWLVTSLFIWSVMSHNLSWLDSLVVAACVTATDPVLASSVVGKGKFAKRVPKHLRDLLSAESGCNDGMAFPFIYLGLYLVRYRPDATEVFKEWFCITVLYECVFGAFYGVVVGYIARIAIRYAHEKDLIDRESFLVFYFVLALFCAGSGSILGMDDLLIGFACGVGFSNDGWFLEKTEEAHVSNVIDLLVNLAFFVYFGTIIPWAQYNDAVLGLSPWRLVVIALLVLFFRRIPIMILLKPVIPDIKTWREALFAGHFGPIGVGAIFVAILARAELETETTTPLAVLPAADFSHDNIIELIWPITTFLVIASIIVHGSSIAVFTLGKHINTLTITMSYTQAQDDGNWMDRLPRIQSRSKTNTSMRRPDASEESLDEKMPSYPAAALGLPRNFLRRQREEDAPSRSSSRRRYGPGGPIEQSAIAPARRTESLTGSDLDRSGSDTVGTKSDESRERGERKRGRHHDDDEPAAEVYQEGNDTVVEDEEGNVLDILKSREGETDEEREERIGQEVRRVVSDSDIEHGVSQKHHPDSERSEPGHTLAKGAEDAVEASTESGGRTRHLFQKLTGLGKRREHDIEEEEPPKAESSQPRRNGPARAFRFGRTIIVEDEDGEVIKKYDIPAPERDKLDRQHSYVDPEKTRQRLHRMGTWLGVGGVEEEKDGESSTTARPQTLRKRSTAVQDADDDKIRFTVGGDSRRMNKEDFIRQIQGLDPRSRAELVEASDAPELVKREARADAREHLLNKHNKVYKPGVLAEAEGEDGGGAAVRKVTSKENWESGPDGLVLVDENNNEFPFHSFSDELGRDRGAETPAQRRRRVAAASRANSSYTQPSQRSEETATERRRREAAVVPNRVDNEDSEDDGTERVPPQRRTVASTNMMTRTRSSSSPHRSKLDQGETAAERRRREGALGVSKEDSDSEEETAPPPVLQEEPQQSRDRRGEQPSQSSTPSSTRARTPGIRFADPEPRTTTSSRLRWSQTAGRKE